MIKLSVSVCLVSTASLSFAVEPFAGSIRDHKGRPVKDAVIYFDVTEKAVKSDKFGRFILLEKSLQDSLHVRIKKQHYCLEIGNQQDLNLIIGEDGRLFEESQYIGETFHGTILNHNGNPIRGAVVYVDDPYDFVKSDRQGRFLIDNIAPDDTLHIKHDGYIHDIAMDGSKGMYIIIGRSNGRRVDDDLVNMGAGMVNARDYNGSRSVLDAKALEETGQTDLLLAMRKIPGCSVYYKNGKLKLSIRASDWPPLWVVDGVQMTDFPGLTVMEVGKVEVLKDGANFGTRGGGGVIIVTTKGSSFK